MNFIQATTTAGTPVLFGCESIATIEPKGPIQSSTTTTITLMDKTKLDIAQPYRVVVGLFAGITRDITNDALARKADADKPKRGK